MARKYSRSASKDVERAMHKKKRGTLKSGRSGKNVTSRKQAIAIAFPKPARKARKFRRRRRVSLTDKSPRDQIHAASASRFISASWERLWSVANEIALSQARIRWAVPSRNF
jgi:hypothetical protein